MTAPTQTTSTGWFYADADNEPATQGWDGRLWPEIVGYRGYEPDPDLASAKNPEPVQRVDATVKSVSERVTAPIAGLPPMFEVVAMPTDTDSSVELPSAALSRVDLQESRSLELTQGQPPEAFAESKTVGHVFLILAVILVLVAIIVGVVL